MPIITILKANCYDYHPRMNETSVAFLRSEGVESPVNSAVYLLVTGGSGVLLGDLGPTLSALDSAYRRLLTLTVSRDLRERLVRHLRDRQPLRNFSRSVNTRFDQLVISDRAQYDMGRAELMRALQHPRPARDEFPYNWDWTPLRLEATRAHFSSPGFVELVGDAATLGVILTFVAAMATLGQKELNDRHARIIATREEQNVTVDLLFRMGYSPEEIAAVGAYVEGDIVTILQRLESRRMVLAPGENVERIVFGK